MIIIYKLNKLSKIILILFKIKIKKWDFFENLLKKIKKIKKINKKLKNLKFKIY